MFVNVDEHFVKAERANEEIFLKCDMHPFTYAVHSVCSLWFKLLKLTGSKQNWDNDLKEQGKWNALKLIPDLKVWIDVSINEILDHFITRSY